MKCTWASIRMTAPTTGLLVALLTIVDELENEMTQPDAGENTTSRGDTWRSSREQGRCIEVRDRAATEAEAHSTSITHGDIFVSDRTVSLRERRGEPPQRHAGDDGPKPGHKGQWRAAQTAGRRTSRAANRYRARDRPRG